MGRSESGNSLIEVLIALVIIGLTATALLAGLATSLTGSAEHRSLASIDTVLKSYAETAKYEIQLQPSGSWFADCATVTPANTYNGNVVSFTPPANYTVVIDSIQYWNSAGTFDAVGAPCVANDKTGLQQLNFKAVGPNGLAQTMSIAVRRAG